MNDIRCVERVSNGMWHTNRCSRKAVQDGYCAQHHPDAVEARREASSARYEREVQERAVQRIEDAVKLLRANGYTVTLPMSADRSP